MKLKTSRLLKNWCAALGVSFALAASLGAPTLAHADEHDPLKQTVAEDEHFSSEPVEIKSGHMDIGPRIIDGKWQLAVRDDSANTPVWRKPDSVVFRLTDKAILTVPESGDYDFTGAQAGQPVHVIPQTQILGVPWLGWNTQSPEVSRSIKRGINLTFLGAQGPGNVNVYLESGNFKKPIQLWDKRKSQPQSIWVDLNTHTHANWVFTKPGVYLLAISASANGLDGKPQAATSIFRFAVGSPDSQTARNTQWQGELPPAPPASAALAQSGAKSGATPSPQSAATASAPQTAPGTSSAQTESSSVNWVPILVSLAGVALLLTALILYFVRTSQARKKAAQEEIDSEFSNPTKNGENT
ncbi:choice-of-anchor M domain-containing protein [Actinomycetaceae bacterium TAE3-ERU4]|nr:choice-of-anchor M domain-containing protein [Actinomycetaceae bacterium TAE3-ERU4]